MKNPPIVNRYKKGISGNPNGRPKKREKEIIKLTYDIVEIYDKANKGNKRYIKKIEKIKEIIER